MTKLDDAAIEHTVIKWQSAEKGEQYMRNEAREMDFRDGALWLLEQAKASAWHDDQVNCDTVEIRKLESLCTDGKN